MRAILNKINKVTDKTDPAEIMNLHDRLTAEEDKLQAAYDEGMRKIHDAHELLNDNSNTGQEDNE